MLQGVGHDVLVTTRLRRIPAIVGIALLACGLMASASSATDAVADSTSQCAAARFCVWSGAAYSGSFAAASSTSLVNLGFTRVSSVWNRSAYAGRVYSGTGGGGTYACFAPGAQLAAVVVSAGSIRLTSSKTC